MKPGTVLLGHVATGQEVYDRFQSHLHEDVKPLMQEALAQVRPGRFENFLTHQVNFDRVVGKTICVVTTTHDEIVFARRPKRGGPSRFVKSRQPEDSHSVVVILKKDEDEGYFILITAFIGELSEPEPWDRSIQGQAARSRAISYWSNHALVWGSEEIIPGTETDQSPW